MQNKKQVLLINLGSPKSLEIKDVKSYLKEFLSDDLVIDLAKPLQQAILRLFILPFRPKKTKEAYQLIWSKEGSPLISNTKKIAKALEKQTGWQVDIAMRYQYPSIRDAIQKYKNNDIKELFVLPLYPHSAISTTLSTDREVKNIINSIHPKLKTVLIKPFYDNPIYIEALSKSIKPYLNNIDKLIFSYHGIPERHVRKGDLSHSHCMKEVNCCEVDCLASHNCYRSNVLKTSELCANKLELNRDKWMVSFQSRVTIIDPNWLKPYTDIELTQLSKNGIKNIAVICPSFVADCLETLEEINMRGRQSFLDFGGESFEYIPCLNDDVFFISALENIIKNSA